MAIIPTEEGDILFQEAGLDEWGRIRINLSFLDDGSFLLKPPITVLLEGIMSPVGVTLKTGFALLAGILSSAGPFHILPIKAITATLAPIGALVKQATKSFVAVVDSVGVFSAVYNAAATLVALSATLDFTGTFERLRQVILSGLLSGVASLEKASTRFIFGSLGFLSTVHNLSSKAISRSLFSAGSLVAAIRKIQMLYGSLLPTAQLTKGLSYIISGVLSFTRSAPLFARMKNLVASLSFEGYYGSKILVYIERTLNFGVLFCRTANWFWVKLVRPTVTVCMTKLTRKED